MAKKKKKIYGGIFPLMEAAEAKPANFTNESFIEAFEELINSVPESYPQFITYGCKTNGVIETTMDNLILCYDVECRFCNKFHKIFNPNH